MRVIEIALRCKHESIKRRIDMLSDSGWLCWEVQGKNHQHRYRVLDGFG